MTTIRQALVALGEVQVRRWVSVIVVSEVAADRPDELMVSTLVDEAGPLWDALQLVLSWESGHWEAVTAAAEALGIEQDELPSSYTRALEFADSSRDDVAPSIAPAVGAPVWDPVS